MVEPRDQRQRDESAHQQRDDDLLDEAPFGHWPSLLAPFQKFGVFDREIEADRVGSRQKDDDEQPCLPIGGRTRGQDNQQRQSNGT
jgi:hypothetical protein